MDARWTVFIHTLQKSSTITQRSQSPVIQAALTFNTAVRRQIGHASNRGEVELRWPSDEAHALHNPFL